MDRDGVSRCRRCRPGTQQLGQKLLFFLGLGLGDPNHGLFGSDIATLSDAPCVSESAPNNRRSLYRIAHLAFVTADSTPDAVRGKGRSGIEPTETAWYGILCWAVCRSGFSYPSVIDATEAGRPPFRPLKAATFGRASALRAHVFCHASPAANNHLAVNAMISVLPV